METSGVGEASAKVVERKDTGHRNAVRTTKVDVRERDTTDMKRYSQTPTYKRSINLSVCSDVESAEEAKASFARFFQPFPSLSAIAVCAVDTM